MRQGITIPLEAFQNQHFVDLVRTLAIERTPAAAEAVVMSLILFREWPQATVRWSAQFMLDSEWNWLDGEPPIDDL